MISDKLRNEIINKKCPICQTNIVLILNYEVPTFRHLDFTTVSNSSKLLKCLNCQIISNPNAVKSELSTFGTKQYAGSHQTQQTMQIGGYTEPVTRSFLQAKVLSKRLNDENQRILDIGCFDGSLLMELDGMLSNADLWGYDINPHLESVFPIKDNFHFISTKLEDLDGQFDLIILSHSILYIQDIASLMNSINCLLKKRGTLFVQIPNIRENVYYSLMGDQSFIFTKTSLKNVLSKFGFKANVIKNDYFPRELLVTAQKDESVVINNTQVDYLFEENIEKINSIKEELKNINKKNITVLGTTVNAAFVDEILGEQILFFVDENPSKSGKLFRGKKIKHPKDLNYSNYTILPYGGLGKIIKERFQKLYKGTFAVV